MSVARIKKLAARVAASPLTATANGEPFQSAIELYQYQREWLADKARFKIGMFARQTGKTFTTALEIVDDVLEHEARGEKTRWVILSRGGRQAKEAMDAGVRRHLEAYQVAGAVYTESEVWLDGVRETQYEITFPGGSKITAVPANPDTARGYSANVFLDEFAFHHDSRRIWTALFPVISAGFRIIITSTPNGKGNKFFELMTGTDPQWSRHITDIYKAVEQGLPRDIDQMRVALADEDAWSQEFKLEWLDEASAWLDYDLINSCEHELAGIPANYSDGACYGGEDIAIRGDLWVGWVKEKLGDVLWTREIRVLRRASFQEQDRNRNELFAKYRMLRYCMDQTGMGEKPVEDAKRRHGSLRVEGVIFTLQTKLLLATCIKQSMQDRKERIPMGDEALRIDLHKIKKEPTATGAARFVADSDSAGHADRFWAGALATYAASSTPMVCDFIRVDPNRGMDEVEDDEDGRFERISPN